MDNNDNEWEKKKKFYSTYVWVLDCGQISKEKNYIRLIWGNTCYMYFKIFKTNFYLSY